MEDASHNGNDADGDGQNIGGNAENADGRNVAIGVMVIRLLTDSLCSRRICYSSILSKSVQVMTFSFDTVVSYVKVVY